MTPLSATLQALIDALPESDRLTFQALQEALYRVRFSGSFTVHCRNGIPKRIDLGPPIALSIVEADPDLDSPSGNV